MLISVSLASLGD